MNRRASLLLMELLVMVLVFALAAAACLGIFAEARLLSEETARMEQAALLAQNAAELLKAGREPVLDTGELELMTEELSPEIPGMKKARVTVLYENTPVFTLDTGWQEVEP